LTRVEFPHGVRVDGWVETGTEVTTSYDPMLAKVIAYGSDRAHALQRLDEALARTRVDGIETNLGLVQAALAEPDFRAATHSTATLATVTDPTPRIEIVAGGTLTTVQDWPGRTGYWQVGVPPCGPMDDLSFRLGNRALGNDEGTPGLECTLQGPTLRFTHATTVCVTGAPAPVTIDGAPVPQWEPVTVPAGATLEIGTPAEHGLRTYVLFAGGLDVPAFLGSASTFTLGRFGGHGGRALRTGDVLHGGTVTEGTPVPPADRPDLRRHLGRRQRSKARTRHRSSSPRTTSATSTRPTGRSTSTRRARASAWSARSPAGPAPTAARRACTRPTSTTPRTRSAPSTTRATCRSCSAPTARPSAASSARRRSSAKSAGNWASSGPATRSASPR
jgi:hypothetical protein